MQDSVVTLLYNILICGSGAERSWFSQYLKLVQHKVGVSNVGGCVFTVVYTIPLVPTLTRVCS